LHGVAAPEQFDERAAVIGFLTPDQLFFFLPLQNPRTTPSSPAKKRLQRIATPAKTGGMKTPHQRISGQKKARESAGRKRRG